MHYFTNIITFKSGIFKQQLHFFLKQGTKKYTDGATDKWKEYPLLINHV